MPEKGEMLASIIEQFLDRKTDSVSISKTTTGKWSFDVKLYCDDLSNPAKQDAIIDNHKKIMASLRATFPDEAKEGK